MALSKDRWGDELIAIYRQVKLEDASSVLNTPLIFSVIVARHQGKVLFVYNVRRQEWELPAGLIELDETPETAAHRELNEESNQTATLYFAGLCVLRLARTGQLEAGAIYEGEIETIQPYISVDGETADLLFWDVDSEVSGYLNDNARKIAEIIQ